jgi:chromate transport protein ChrA
MTSVAFWGALNTLLITASVFGVFSQLSTIHSRRQTASSTALLSLNQFTVSFFAYFSFFVYGYSMTPFNHFIVWPRLVASLVVLAILYEMVKDRKTKPTYYAFITGLSAMFLGLVGLLIGDPIEQGGKWVSTALMLCISILIAQGYAHQIKLIIKSGETGAVDIRMSQFILLMDLSTIALAISIGLRSSWPLMVLAVTSALTKVCILYLFRWVRVSQLAKHRRQSHRVFNG